VAGGMAGANIWSRTLSKKKIEGVERKENAA